MELLRDKIYQVLLEGKRGIGGASASVPIFFMGLNLLSSKKTRAYSLRFLIIFLMIAAAALYAARADSISDIFPASVDAPFYYVSDNIENNKDELLTELIYDEAVSHGNFTAFDLDWAYWNANNISRLNASKAGHFVRLYGNKYTGSSTCDTLSNCEWTFFTYFDQPILISNSTQISFDCYYANNQFVYFHMFNSTGDTLLTLASENGVDRIGQNYGNAVDGTALWDQCASLWDRVNFTVKDISVLSSRDYSDPNNLVYGIGFSMINNADIVLYIGNLTMSGVINYTDNALPAGEISADKFTCMNESGLARVTLNNTMTDPEGDTIYYSVQETKTTSTLIAYSFDKGSYTFFPDWRIIEPVTIPIKDESIFDNSSYRSDCEYVCWWIFCLEDNPYRIVKTPLNDYAMLNDDCNAGFTLDAPNINQDDWSFLFEWLPAAASDFVEVKLVDEYTGLAFIDVKIVYNGTNNYTAYNATGGEIMSVISADENLRVIFTDIMYSTQDYTLIMGDRDAGGYTYIGDMTNVAFDNPGSLLSNVYFNNTAGTMLNTIALLDNYQVSDWTTSLDQTFVYDRQGYHELEIKVSDSLHYLSNIYLSKNVSYSILARCLDGHILTDDTPPVSQEERGSTWNFFRVIRSFTAPARALPSMAIIHSVAGFFYFVMFIIFLFTMKDLVWALFSSSFIAFIYSILGFAPASVMIVSGILAAAAAGFFIMASFQDGGSGGGQDG